MTDYTERFRTLSIQQMQQVLAVCADYVTNLSTAPSEAKERIDVILEQTVGRTWEQLFASKYDGEPSRIIRSGDLVVGKRYRIVEISPGDPNPSLKAGDVVVCAPERLRCIDREDRSDDGMGVAWFADFDVGKNEYRTLVTAVELVEDEPEDDGNGPRRHTRECNGESDPDGGGAPCDCGGIDPTIIRAAEGVTLEPGDYISLDHEDLTFGLERLRSPVNRNGRMCWLVDGGGFEVTAVRRVDPKPASEPVAPAGAEPGFINYCAICCWMGFNSSCPNCNGDSGLHRYVRASSPPQQPAEGVEPVAEEATCRNWLRAEVASLRHERDVALQKVTDLSRELVTFEVVKQDRAQLRDQRDIWEENERKLETERDAALATVAGLESEKNQLSALYGSRGRYLDAAHATEAELRAAIAKLETELEAAREQIAKFEVHFREEEADLIATKKQLEVARAGLDPKACGELIADIDAAIGYGGPNEGVDIDARAAIRELAAMLGVEVQP